jgi:protein arginine N-methyltransferase 2
LVAAPIFSLCCAGVRAELLCGALERKSGRPEEAASSAAYLRQPLQYGEGGDGANVLMDNKQAVMMAWELPLMDAHANVICTGRGDVLNIGFGLGIIDEVIAFKFFCLPSSQNPTLS